MENALPVTHANKMKEIVHTIDAHPTLNFIVSVTLLVAGKFVKLFYLLQSEAIHIPPVVIESMQIVAYAGGGAAGFVALHGWYAKTKSPKPKKK